MIQSAHSSCDESRCRRAHEFRKLSRRRPARERKKKMAALSNAAAATMTANCNISMKYLMADNEMIVRGGNSDV